MQYLVSKETKAIRSVPINNVSTDGFYVVDEGLGKRIIAVQPFYDFVIENDQLVDIIELEKPPEPPPEPTEMDELENYVLDVDMRLLLVEMGL